MSQLLRNALLVGLDPSDPDLARLPREAGAARGQLLLEGERIRAVLPPEAAPPPGAEVHDLRGQWVLPGFVQTHIHLVQTLFRGLADDLQLLDWLSQRIWPLERAHDEESVYWSARLGLTELLLGGTTAVLDMATVHHTDAVFRAAEEVGMRAAIGKALMDRDNEAGLGEDTDTGLQSASDLCSRWHGRGRLRYAWSPRFVPSCSDRLLRESVRLARASGCLLHTHASENPHECTLVEELTGRRNVDYLDEVGFSGEDVVLAHCIHLDDAEIGTLARTRTTVAHCPGSNLKLASGIAPIPRLLREGVRCTLGADGAPCNNRLDAFAEMRLAALIQKPLHGADAMPAEVVFDMATRAGAEALGLHAGLLAPGRLADLVILDPRAVPTWGGGSAVGALVYAHTPAAVREVWIGGAPVVRDGQVLGWDLAETVAGAEAALRRVRARADL